MQATIAEHALNLDHVAIAVPDLESSIAWYTKSFGFEVAERRETKGRKTGMVSAVLTGGPITLVLVQGTSPESQVSKYIEHYGPGVQHIAVGVRDLPKLAKSLEASSVELDTGLIEGDGICQLFTKRDPGSGMMFELIERKGGSFSDETVQQLFEQLEESDSY